MQKCGYNNTSFPLIHSEQYCLNQWLPELITIFDPNHLKVHTTDALRAKPFSKFFLAQGVKLQPTTNYPLTKLFNACSAHLSDISDAIRMSFNQSMFSLALHFLWFCLTKKHNHGSCYHHNHNYYSHRNRTTHKTLVIMSSSQSLGDKKQISSTLHAHAKFSQQS